MGYISATDSAGNLSRSSGYLGGWKVLFTAIMSKKLVKLTFSPLLQAFILKVVDDFLVMTQSSQILSQ